MDELAPRRIEIEELTFTGDIPLNSYDSMLGNVGQAVYEFRALFGDPDDETLPVVESYQSRHIDVSLISLRPSHIRVQIASPAGRTGVTYDSTKDQPVIIDAFGDASSDEPTDSYALIPGEENSHRLLSLYAYIREATVADNRADS